LLVTPDGIWAAPIADVLSLLLAAPASCGKQREETRWEWQAG
jgi:hypothetical protein